jgi:cytochrome c553
MRKSNRTLKLLVLLFSASVIWVIYAPGALTAGRAVAQSAEAEFFEKKIRPLFATHCAKCHNATAQVAELDLTSAEGFAKGGASGPLINQEKPEESRLLKAVGYQEKLKMPPSGKLKDEELAALAAWVKTGAIWPKTPVARAEAGAAKSAGAKPAREFSAAEKAFWSFQPLVPLSAPKVKNTAWVKSVIDAFILQKLEEKGIAPAPPADRLTLLRRATYDLTGLPPTEQEIQAFLADDDPDAFAKVVNRLLSSPRYGEKWGRNWLDVARYADSTGNDEDHRYPNAWRYRDYVIEAFNRDLPYDQFVREQVAGDLLPSPDGQEVNRRGIIATGFLALGPKAIAQQDKPKMLYDVYDEQVEVLGKAFLGLTVACARCHDHKFDPILTKDYYALTGIFASTRSFSAPYEFVSQHLNKPLVPKAEWEAYQAKKKAHEQQLKHRQLEQGEIADHVKEQLVAPQVAQLAEYMLAARSIYQDKAELKTVAGQSKLDAELLQKWVNYLKVEKPKLHLLEWQKATPETLRTVAVNYQQRFQERLGKWQARVNEWRGKYQKALAENKPLPDKPDFEDGEDRFFAEAYFGKGPFSVTAEDKARFNETDWQRLAKLKSEIEILRKQAPPEPEMATAVEEGEPVNQKIFVRGDHHNPGEDAPRAIPTILAPRTQAPQFSTGSGRRELAEWLTQPEHPLTARVMANRLWLWHFGEGLVRTPDNFGKMGERPTHPELLDFLARRFIESGWSVKAMHRLLMLSSAYQMASSPTDAAVAADPDNRLFSRFPRRRLTVEELRDALLAIDGTLDLTMGGTLQSGRGTDGENAAGRLSLNPEKLKRRTVYLPLRRANLPALLNLFDFGDATVMSGKRQLTNVATQALFWMNSEFVSDRARQLAAELVERQQSLSDEARVRLAYLRILNRQATREEVAQSLTYLDAVKQKHAPENTPVTAWQSLCRVLLSSNDFLYLD